MFGSRSWLANCQVCMLATSLYIANWQVSKVLTCEKIQIHDNTNEILSWIYENGPVLMSVESELYKI